MYCWCVPLSTTVWDPHLKRHHAARWITRDYGKRSSVTAALNDLELEPLEKCRQAACLTLIYKILHRHIAVTPEDLNLTFED